jgi:transposase
MVMDNLNFHKMKAVRALIEAATPIELWWADMKRHLRKAAINVETELRAAARRLRSTLPLSKIAGWFRKALREAQVK